MRESSGAKPRVEFPDMFREQLARFIPDPDLLDFFLEFSIKPAVEGGYESLLLPTGNDGVLATVDGHLGIPALWLWFFAGTARDGVRFAVFNRAELQQPLNEVEDDSN